MNIKLSSPCINMNLTKGIRSVTFFYPGINDSYSCPYVITLPSGRYTFECWGASGGYYHGEGGLGGYTYGNISMNRTTAFYLYLGSMKLKGISSFVDNFNGGGTGDAFGGGATDFRYIGGEWYDFYSMKSRIMVAGGGGGSDGGVNHRGGSGGGLNGGAAPFNGPGTGGGQTYGGSGFVGGSFGRGGSNINFDGNGTRKDSAGGGGGGYYGGGTGLGSTCCGGGGGSSFISGHPGCNSINDSSTEWSIVHFENEYHYSGIFFENTSTIMGNNTMPLPSGDFGIGYYGYGAARIYSYDVDIYLATTIYCNGYVITSLYVPSLFIFTVFS